MLQHGVMRDYVYVESLAVISGLRVEHLALNLCVTELLLSFQIQPLLALPTYRRACLKATWWAMTIRFTSSSARRERSLISLTTPLCHALLVCVRWVMPEGTDGFFFLLLSSLYKFFQTRRMSRCRIHFRLNTSFLVRLSAETVFMIKCKTKTKEMSRLAQL